MKKTRILALAVIVAVMLMGAGYAAWTDRLTINNTVGTGELKVEFVDDEVFPLIGDFDYTLEENNYIESSINQNDPKTTTVTISNMYPGNLVFYEALFENKGTIPAVVSGVDVKFTTPNKPLQDNLHVWGGFIHFDKNWNYKGGNWFNTRLGNLDMALNRVLANERMEPGDKIVFDIPDEYKDDLQADTEGAYDPSKGKCIQFHLPGSVGDSLEKQSTTFTIELNFKQHNQ